MPLHSDLGGRCCHQVLAIGEASCRPSTEQHLVPVAYHLPGKALCNEQSSYMVYSCFSFICTVAKWCSVHSLVWLQTTFNPADQHADWWVGCARDSHISSSLLGHFPPPPPSTSTEHWSTTCQAEHLALHQQENHLPDWAPGFHQKTCSHKQSTATQRLS